VGNKFKGTAPFKCIVNKCWANWDYHYASSASFAAFSAAFLAFYLSLFLLFFSALDKPASPSASAAGS
jgi:hypothetical protein